MRKDDDASVCMIVYVYGALDVAVQKTTIRNEQNIFH